MRIGAAAYWACVLEASARKPGNVHPARSFSDLTYADLLACAAAIAPILEAAPNGPVGQTILDCVRASQRVATTNTNLGIVLLLVPLATDDNVGQVLNNLTVEDTVNTYEAVRLANPGGLGQVSEQDVKSSPTATLRDVMALAQGRDQIARQYVNNFAEVVAGVHQLESITKVDNKNLEADIIRLHLWFMAQFPDSLVVRKRGDEEGRELQVLAKAALADPGEIAKLDAWFAAEVPFRNPGTSADLVCASLYVALRRGIITLPFFAG